MFWRAGSTSIRRVTFNFTTNLARDGELGGVFSVLPKQIREEAPTCVDEPVTYLGIDGRFLASTELIRTTDIDVVLLKELLKRKKG